MQVNKITESLYNSYKSSIKEIKLGDFGVFLPLYDVIYDGQNAEIIKGPYLNSNNNYYCVIYINGEEREVFLELIKHFTNMKNYVTLDENLFTL